MPTPTETHPFRRVAPMLAIAVAILAGALAWDALQWAVAAVRWLVG